MTHLLLALSRRLLLLAMDAAVRQALPVIYRRLDARLLLLITNNAPPSIVRGAIASVISDTTRRRATPEQVDAVIGLYDPVAAARNHLISRQ